MDSGFVVVFIVVVVIVSGGGGSSRASDSTGSGSSYYLQCKQVALVYLLFSCVDLLLFVVV